MERLLPKRRLKQTPDERGPKKLLISHHPSISSEVEEPQPGPQMVAAFRTAQLRSDRQKRGSIKSAPLYPRSEPDSKIRLALYSSSFGSISDTTNDGKQQGAGKRLSSHEQEDYDPILAHITAQRSRLGLQTTPTKSPDTAEGSNYMDLLLATSEPIAGVRDLKKLSKKLSHMRLESEGRVQERKVIARDFVYAVQKGDRGRGAKYNPYDLRIVPADIARQHSLHYTISAFSVSEVDKFGNLSPVHVLRWLWERDMINQLWSIPFFKKFKLWKLFAGWRKWIYMQKFSKSKKTLEIGLFSADVVFQKALLEIQAICMSASGTSKPRGSQNIGEISLLTFSKDHTYTLSEFMSLQANKSSQARERLFQLRERILDVVFSALRVVGEREGMFVINSDGIPQEPDEEPTHTRVLEWRPVRKKLRRFEQTCSHLVLGVMQQLVMAAVSSLEAGIRRASGEAAKRTQVQREEFLRMREEIASQPYTQGVLDRQQEIISTDELSRDMELLTLQASSFSGMLSEMDLDVFTSSEWLEASSPAPSTPVPTPNSMDFLDQLLHSSTPQPILPLWEVRLTLLLDHEEEEEVVVVTGEEGEGGKVVHKVVYEPSDQEFQEALRSLLQQWEDIIASFQPISEDVRIKPFLQHSQYDLLMLLDDPQEDRRRVGGRTGGRAGGSGGGRGGGRGGRRGLEEKPAPWPDVEVLLHEYGPYRQSVGYIKRTVHATMMGVHQLAKHYKSYGELTQHCSGVNIAASLQSEDWNVPMFQRAFALYHDQVHAINNMVTSFLVGVVGVKAEEFKEVCLAYPTNILTELEFEFPKLVAQKADRLVADIKTGTDKMLTVPADMSAFIQFLSDAKQVESSVPLMETRLTTITNLYNVAQQFEVPVSEEEMALYKSLFTRFRQLKNALMQAQATMSECVHQFSALIRSQMVDILHHAMDLKVKSEALMQLDESSEPSSVRPLEKIMQLKSSLDSLVEQSKQYVEYYHLFAKIPSSKRYYTLDPSTQSWTPEEVYDEVLGVQEFMKTKQTLYETKESWEAKVVRWYSAPLLTLDFGKLKKEVNSFMKTVNHLEKNIPAKHKLLQVLHAEVTQFSSWLPTVACLLNPALKFRHWDSIRHYTGDQLSLGRDSSFTISDLKEHKIFDHHSSIAMISNQANHEETLENMLKKISMEWNSKEFEMVPYKGVSERTTFVLTGVEEMFASLEDSLTVLNIIKSSRYVGPIRHSVLDWVSRLTLALETVEYWVLCQKNWLYLENVFTAVEIQRQLSAETRMFLHADKSWRLLIKLIREKPTALKALTTPGILEAFKACNVLLEQVFKSLEDYLEAKRVVFPRLNFISNTELLDILSHSKDLDSVQPYFSKLFGNIKCLEFADEKVSPQIIAMVSAEDEKICIFRKCHARGSPEQWLSVFAEVMQGTVKDLLKTGMSTYSKEDRHQWALANPGQIVLTVNQIHWTAEVTACIKSSSPHSRLVSHHQEYSNSLAVIASTLKNESLHPSKRCIIAALLTLDLHNRDVIGALVSSKVTSNKDFEWTRHLRYYWEQESGVCLVHQSCARFRYINEYLGCLPRLVITPLSERCYLTLTTAMHLHLGGSPIGPAGTGKSETVKDLAKALGQLCIVINCSEGLDYKMMGRYFSGLCQSGIWCCFDEFNRIDVEVLSVVAQQLHCIKTAKDCHASSFIFEGRDVKLVPSCSLFITMNPGYTGRVELPDNLKSYFRPVAMMVPDTNMIAEVLLFTNCFTTASSLALKLTKFYEMVKSQVSHQDHYYFGLRSVKAVIGLAGEYLKSSEGGAELKALLQAIRHTTLPRLVARDVPTVQTILWDLFHTSDCRIMDDTYTTLNSYVKQARARLFLEHCPSQVQKCHELYNTLLVRHGVILLGPTGGGKTSVVKLLATALNKSHMDYYGPKSYHVISTEPSSMSITGSISQAFTGPPRHCRLETINPKSVSVGELYGHSDKFTLEWKNGVLARLLLSFCTQTEYELYFKEKEKRAKTPEASKDPVMMSATELGDGSGTVASYPALTSLSVRSSLTASYQYSRGRPQSHPFGLPYPACAPAGWRWALLDGPVDSEWVENLNSVLDDSMVLCLSNGERIRLMPGSRVLFESDSLANASPATVSRCAVIFLDPYELGWRPLVKSWLKTLPDDLPLLAVQHILSLFEHSMDAGLEFLRLHSPELCSPLPGLSAVKTLCCLLDGLIRSVAEYHGGFTDPEASEKGVGGERSEEASTSQLHAQTLAGIYIPTRTQQQGAATTAGVGPGAGPEQRSRVSLSLPDADKPLHQRKPGSLLTILTNLFVFAFTWAFGGCFQRHEEEVDLDISGDDLTGEIPSQKITRGGALALEKFDALVYDLFSEGPMKARLPPSARLIYSYYPDIYSNSFQPFDKLISSPVQNVSFLSPGIKGMVGSMEFVFNLFSNPSEDICSASRVTMIPTADVVCLSFLVAVMVESHAMPNVMVSGKPGVGKTQLLEFLSKSVLSKKWRKHVIQCMMGKPMLKGEIERERESGESEEDPRTDVEEHTFSTLLYHVSTRLSSEHLQGMLSSYLMRQGRSLLIPPTGKNLLVCLDDLHAAPSDGHQSSASLELLRQIIDGGGWYSRKSRLWKDVVGVNFLATQCTGSVARSKSCVSERLLSKFCLLNLPEASCRSLHNVYSTHCLKSFTANMFSREVLNCITKLTALSIFTLHTCRAELTPSPHKPQYVFCLKDLSKVFSRLLRLHHRGLSCEAEVIQVVTNELAKVFHDRCMPEDRDKVLFILIEGIRRYYKDVLMIEKVREQLVDLPYSDFLETTKGYCPVSNKHKLSRHLEKIQVQFNSTEDKNSQLLFFPLACDQIVRMVRILQVPNGHMLLIGLGGVGRRSCVQMAAYIAGMKYHCITPIHPQTPFSDCLEEVKGVLRQCGLHNQPTVLLATDSAAGEHQDSFFNLLHELVVGGEILSLYDRDEIEIILGQLMEDITVKDVDLQGAELSPEDLKQLFVKRVLSCIRVVLCFSPVSAKLAEVSQKFPGIVTSTTVDVFDEWPAKAMYGVAIKEMQTVRNSQLFKDSLTDVASVCVKLFGVVHSASRKTGDLSQLSFVLTPSSFIQFIRTFAKLLDQEHDKLNMKRIHLDLGVGHLTEADQKVVQMKSELQQLQPQVLEKAEEVELLLLELAEEQKEVDALRASVFKERMEIAKETEHVTSLAREAEEDLESILPELKAAEKGLSALKKSDLTEIRSYGTPPSMVMNVMSSVCVLLKEPTEWNAIKHLMADPVGFLRRLTSLDKDKVSDKTLSKLKKYTRDPNFTADKMVQYSVACQSFCQWVLAVEGYCRVYRVVQPKRELHWKISDELEAVVGRLQAKELQLNELQARMAVLTEQCAVKKAERDKLQEKYQDIEIKLKRAEILMQSLGHEKDRWRETISDLESKSCTLIGDTLLLSSSLTFLGPFTPHVRHSLLAKWKHVCQECKVLCDGNFSLEGKLCDSEKIQEWYVQGLPKDTQSLQNAALLTATEKYPFIVDPQSQAIKWLKTMLASSNLLVQEYGSAKMLQYLEHAARAGLPLMIKSVPEQLSSVLDPFLQSKASEDSEDRQVIKVGKTEIECNPSFRLFLISSKLSNKLPSDTCTKTTVINFSATLEGYQDQLLSATIHIKEPTLETQFNDLLLSISHDTKQLEKLEQKLLECLSSSKGDLLENEELIDMLKGATHTASEVKQRLQKALETKESISTSRLKYEKVAKRGSILFFTVLSLSNLDPVYTFSSDWFMDVFRGCVTSIRPPITSMSHKSDDEGADSAEASFKAYVREIVDFLTLTVYSKVSYGILTRHSLLFAFKLCCMLLLHQDQSLRHPFSIRRSEWTTLLREGVASDSELAMDSQHSSKLVVPGSTKFQKPEEISYEAWEGATTLDKAVAAFNGLVLHIVHNVGLWVEFSKSERPWLVKFDEEEVEQPQQPAEPRVSKSRRRSSTARFLLGSLNHFQRLLLVNVFCPHRIAESARWLVETQLGSEYTAGLPRDLKTIYPLTGPVTPTLIVITPNVDPTAQLLQLAEDHVQFLDTISLGQGQGDKASKTVCVAAKAGRWVFLQNCHLASSWMPQLEAMIKELQAMMEISENFRLWLSSKSTAVLPHVLLQSSIKVCLEPPTSVKANMHQVLSSRGTATITSSDFDHGDVRQWQQLVFRLCLFHSVVNARRAYGNEGWRVPYVFGPNDLKVSIQLLQYVFKVQGGRREEGRQIHWDAVHHLVGEICYGGKVTNTQDLRTLRALLHRHCSQQAIDEGYGDIEPGSVTPGLRYDTLSRLILRLSDTDTPDALGLSPVLQSTLVRNESKSLLSMLCLLETTSKKGYVESKRDEVVMDRAVEILDQLPPPLKPFTLLAGSPRSWSDLPPFWVVLCNEVEALNEKLSLLKRSLKGVMEEVKGELVVVVEGVATEQAYKALAENLAPDSWKFGQDAPSSLPDWMEWFLKLYGFLFKWVSINMSEIANSNFVSPPKLPSKFWLPAFSFTNGLFEAIKQTHSRTVHVPVEEVSIKFDDIRCLKESPETAVIISGMKLGLAEWNSDRGIVQTTKAEQYSLMGDMICYPIHDKSPSNMKESDKYYWYPCPLYASSAKREFISTIALRTAEQPDHLDMIGITLTL